MDVEEPKTLVRLPRSLQLHWKIQFGSAFSVRNRVKRKCQEICAAVDGDSVNVYNVQTGSISASHAVPPDSAFVGPPCSIRSKTNSETYHRVYCAVKRERTRIHCYETKQIEGRTSSSEISLEYPASESPIVLLDVLWTGETTRILVLHEDGLLSTLSSDLTEIISTKRIFQDFEKSHRIRIAKIVERVEAEKGVLKQRPDITSSANADVQYLVTISETLGETGDPASQSTDVEYNLCKIEGLPEVAGGSQSQITSLVQYPLDNLTISQAKSPWARNPYVLGTRAANLYIKQPQGVYAYDLTALSPKRTAILPSGFSGYQDVFPVSSYILLSTFSGVLRLYDIEYSTLQARRDLRKPSLKRQRRSAGYETSSGVVELIAYFPRLNRCLARRGTQILAIDLRNSTKSDLYSHQITRPSLIACVGRGVKPQDVIWTTPATNSSSLGSTGLKSQTVTKWQRTRKRLDDLARQGDLTTFEQVFIEDVTNYKPQESDHIEDSQDDKSIEDQSYNAAENAWTDTMALAHVPDMKVDYILSKLFRVQSTTTEESKRSDQVGSKVQLCFKARKLLVWLAKIGALSRQRLQSNVFEFPQPMTDESLISGCIVYALINADESLSLLQDYLRYNRNSDVHEQATEVRILIQRAVEELPVSAITEPDLSNDHPTIAENELSLLPETTFAALGANSSDHTNWMSPDLFKSLELSLARFGSNPLELISPQIRSSFSQTELICLVQFLRQQLFLGGHMQSSKIKDQTSPHIDPYQPVNTFQGQDDTQWPLDHGLDVVTKLLSACLDAIGSRGHFGPSEVETSFVDSIVVDLRSEIARTLTGIEDALELKNMLRETLRYADLVSERHQKVENETNKQNNPDFEKDIGPNTVSYAGDSVYGFEDSSTKMLPLNLGDEVAINPYAIRSGGRAMEREAQKRFGRDSRIQRPYSFERLIL